MDQNLKKEWQKNQLTSKIWAQMDSNGQKCYQLGTNGLTNKRELDIGHVILAPCIANFRNLDIGHVILAAGIYSQFS